jgi:predicted kinase
MMRKHIVVEGFDGTGKTTLANAIAERYNGTVRHVGERPTSRREVLQRCARTEQVCRAASSAERLLVLDRHPAVSESAYGDHGGLDSRTVGAELVMCRVAAVVWCDVDDARDVRIRARDTRADVEATAAAHGRTVPMLAAYGALMGSLEAGGVVVVRHVLGAPVEPLFGRLDELLGRSDEL